MANSEILEYSLTLPSCFLSQSGENVLNDLKQLLNISYSHAPDVKVVVIYQEVMGHESQDEWINELSTSLLRVDLVHRLLMLRNILMNISKSPIPWVYVSRQDCLDSYFDLAMSCQFRIFTSRNAQVGYSCLKERIYPVGGFLERNLSVKKRTDEQWLNQPVFSSHKLFQYKLADVCINVGETRKTVLNWIEKNINFPVKDKKNDRKNAVELVKVDETLQKIRFEWQKSKYGLEQYNSSTEQLKTIFDHKSWFKHPNQMEYIICETLAKVILSNDYRNYIKNLKRSVKDQNEDVWLTVPIYINLNYLSPPMKLLERLFKNKRTVVFYASRTIVLANNLQKIYSRFEREFSASVAKFYWDEFVSWKVCQFESIKGIDTKWDHNDLLTITVNAKKIMFYCLEGNLFKSNLGVCEYLQNVDQDENASNGCDFILVEKAIVTKLLDGNLTPISVWLRSFFLEEIMRFSACYLKSYSEIMKLLANKKWGFIGDIEQWDRFLTNRYSTWPTLDNNHEVLKKLNLSIDVWNINNWKHTSKIKLKPLITNIGHSESQIDTHFAILTGLLSHFIFKHNLVNSLEDASELCSAAIGFPKRLVTPVNFIRKVGIKRIFAYGMSNWPSLVSTFSLEEFHEF